MLVCGLSLIPPGRLVRPKYWEASGLFSLCFVTAFDVRRTQPKLNGWLNYQKYVIDSTGKVRAHLKASDARERFFFHEHSLDPRALLRMTSREKELLGTLDQDCL